MREMSVNPYSPGNPVDPKHFAGRLDIIDEVRKGIETCKAGFPTNIFIQGDWGIGKTSLIRKLMPILEEHIGLVVRSEVDGSQAKDQSFAFFSEVLDSMSQKLPGNPESDDDEDDDIEIPSYSHYNNTRRMQEHMTENLSRLRNERGLMVAIVLDNLETAESKFIKRVKDVFQRVEEDEKHFMLLFAGKELPGVGESAADPVGRFFRTIPVGPLDLEETREAIAKPIRLIADFRVEDDAADFIYQRTEGHPYFIKQICSRAFTLANGQDTIDTLWLEKHWDKIEAELSDQRFQDELGDLPASQREVLMQACWIGNEFRRADLYSEKTDTLDSAIKRLCDERQLIKRVNRGTYRFYHPLFHNFVRKVADKNPEILHPVHEIIKAGEGTKCEFKQTYGYCNNRKQGHDKIVKSALKTIAAFLNTDGGKLLIGVADNGEITGLEKDLALCKPKNQDGFQRRIRDHMRSRFTPPPTSHVDIKIVKLPEGEVCIITVPQGSKPTYVGEDEFYVRDGNRTLQLKSAERDSFIEERF